MCYILSIQTIIQLAFFSARARCCPAQLIVLCDLQVCFYKVDSKKIGPQPELVLKFIPPLVQDFSFAFLDLHGGTISPFLWVAEVPLQSCPAFHHIDCSIKSVIMCKIAGSALPHITMVIKDTTKY